MKTKVILCMDPGKFNFAWSIINYSGKLLDYSLLHETFTNLTDSDNIINGCKIIHDTIDYIHDTWSFKEYSFNLVYERFMPRSLQRGNLSEIVNMAIGIVLSSFPKRKKINITALTAATWKNYVKRQKWNIENNTIPIHILDSYMMGIYYLHHGGLLSSEKVIKNINHINKQRYGWKFTKNVWVPPSD